MSKKKPKVKSAKPVKFAGMSASHQASIPHPQEINGVVALFTEGRYAEAATLARAMTTRFPLFGFGWKVLGVVLCQMGRTADAIAPMRKAAALSPGDDTAYFNLGNALQDLGRHDGALASYRQALAIEPAFAEAHNNLGNTLREIGRPDDAMASYRRALAIKPDYAEVHNNLGSALQGMGRLDDAAASCRRALAIKPDFAEAHNNLGTALRDLGLADEAAASYRRALAIKPDFAGAHSNLGNALTDFGRVDEAVASYRRALAIKPDFALAHSNLLFALAHHAMVPAAQLLAEARRWQAQVIPEAASAAARLRDFRRLPREGRRLRVGYVSGDLRQHAVSYFVESIFRLHDRSRVELFAYSTSGTRDAITDKLEALVDHWAVMAGLSDEAARQRIEADQIDVLIDLSGHSAHGRLGVFALRAAPVQAHYLGYFATTGLTEMDYWLGDPVLLPEAEDAHYSEKIWRLPRVWVGYEVLRGAPSPKWHPAADGTVWLGSFNSLNKLTPATLAVWAKLLHALPEARLLLKTRALAEPVNKERIKAAMAAHGIGAERLELLANTDDWTSHMALYDRLDIALDPIGGVGGGTTTCDALWMGVPVITLAGQQMAQRMTASMLDAIGHREWITATEDDYIATVVTLARDVEQRRSLRSSQREGMRNSPLCDAAGLVRSLEDAYEAMFDAWWRSAARSIGNSIDGATGGQGNQPC